VKILASILINWARWQTGLAVAILILSVGVIEYDGLVARLSAVAMAFIAGLWTASALFVPKMLQLLGQLRRDEERIVGLQERVGAYFTNALTEPPGRLILDLMKALRNLQES
jgi:hypothetical protein